MAEKKYEKYFTVLHTTPGFYKDETMIGKATDGPPMYGRAVSEFAPVHFWVDYMFGTDFGFGMGSTTGDEHMGTHTEGPHRHNCDELFCFFGTDHTNPDDLGAEVEMWMGEGDDAEMYIIDKPTVVFIPAGVLHNPTWVRKLDKPFIFMPILMSPKSYEVNTDKFPTAFKGPKGWKRPESKNLEEYIE